MHEFQSVQAGMGEFYINTDRSNCKHVSWKQNQKEGKKHAYNYTIIFYQKITFADELGGAPTA